MEEINIEDKLQAFRKHLEFNNRTILSAQYGDGKTYFLNKFKETYKSEYEFITLYPVNYQVANNKEIFEYIKRDILIQMVMNGIVQPDCQISDAHYLQHYIMGNHLTLLQDIIQVLPSLGIENDGSFWSNFMIGFKGLLFLQKQKKIYDQFKEKINSQSDIELAEQFCNIFSKEKGGIYELDLITEIIIQSLKKFKEKDKDGKKVVLIIEDMDRLDPAHLFRLLNIFSAHLDRYNIYKKTSNIGDYVLCNKFGFDNIITVFDYDNTKKIFAHFYGENANFEGYINKFTSGNAFRYSINEIARKQLVQLLINECLVDIDSLEYRSKLDLPSHDIHKFIKALNVRDIQKIMSKYDESLGKDVIEFKTGVRIPTNNTLTRFISILNLMDLDRIMIMDIILGLPDIFTLRCVGCFLLSIPEILSRNFMYNTRNYIWGRLSTTKKDFDKIEVAPIDVKYGGSTISKEQIKSCINKAFKIVY